MMSSLAGRAMTCWIPGLARTLSTSGAGTGTTG